MRDQSTHIKVRNWRIIAFVLAVLLGYSIVGHNDRRVAATCGGHLKYTSVLLARG
jgi:hypothetical protein